jgi:hypothetical protein
MLEREVELVLSAGIKSELSGKEKEPVKMSKQSLDKRKTKRAQSHGT